MKWSLVFLILLVAATAAGAEKISLSQYYPARDKLVLCIAMEPLIRLQLFLYGCNLLFFC